MAEQNASSPGVLVAVNVHRACHVTTIVIATVLTILDVISIRKTSKGFVYTKPASRIRYWQLFVAIGIIAHSICFSIALFGDFRNKPQDCHYLMGLVPLICELLLLLRHFIIELTHDAVIQVKMCMSFFLYDRAKVVHDALRLKWKALVLLRWVIWLAILGLLPVFAAPIILFFYGIVLPEGVCIQICSKWEIPFAVSIPSSNMNG